MADPLIYAGFSSALGVSGRLLGGLIRAFTGGDVNHAFFVYWDENWDSWLTVGANSNGLTIMSLNEFTRTRTIVHAYRMTAPGRTLWDGLRIHVADLDKAYNFSGLFGMAGVEVVKKITGRPGANILSNNHELFCSEWCAMVIREALKRQQFLAGYGFNQIDPSTLSEGLANSPWFQSVDDPNNLRRPDNG